MSRKKIHLFILLFAFAACSWILLNNYLIKADKPLVNVCLFRMVTGIPCPSCGTTHALISIVRGNFRTAFYENILGFPAAVMLLVFPVWIICDLLFKRESFYRFYRNVESFLRKRWVAWTALGLLLLIWGWNLYRYFS
ncbi:MAG: DUF2752 domain-containing protein [Bacteroidetes bacterium]|nr:DUF2752 domain-containing protein [Bacteroidota bacterium]